MDYQRRSAFIEQFSPEDRSEKYRSLTVIPIDDNLVEDNETYHMIINEQLLLNEYPCICAHNTITNITIVNDDCKYFIIMCLQNVSCINIIAALEIAALEMLPMLG